MDADIAPIAIAPDLRLQPIGALLKGFQKGLRGRGQSVPWTAAAGRAFWRGMAGAGRGSLRSLRLCDRRLSGIMSRSVRLAFGAAAEAQIR